MPEIGASVSSAAGCPIASGPLDRLAGQAERAQEQRQVAQVDYAVAVDIALILVTRQAKVAQQLSQVGQIDRPVAVHVAGAFSEYEINLPAYFAAGICRGVHVGIRAAVEQRRLVCGPVSPEAELARTSRQGGQHAGGHAARRESVYVRRRLGRSQSTVPDIKAELVRRAIQ